MIRNTKNQMDVFYNVKLFRKRKFKITSKELKEKIEKKYITIYTQRYSVIITSILFR